MTFDGNLGQFEWQGALTFDGTFVLPETSHYPGEYPFELSLLGDENWMYVGVVVRGSSKLRVEEEGRKFLSAEHLDLLFAPYEGALVPPADRIGASHVWENGAATLDSYWNGEYWVVQDKMEDGDVIDGKPTGCRWIQGTRAPDDEHAIVYEMFVSRSSHLEINKFHYPTRGAFRMGLLFFREHPDNGMGIEQFSDSDTYPGDGPTRTEGDPTTWIPLKFTY